MSCPKDCGFESHLIQYTSWKWGQNHARINCRKIRNLKKFLVYPIWLPVFFLFFYNEPGLGVGIDPGMALTPLPSSIGLGSNPRPSDHEPSALPLDHSFCFKNKKLTHR